MSENITKIPNIYLDYWISILKPSDFKILIFICFRNKGNSEISSHISITEFVDFTGLSRNTVKWSIEDLRNFGLINQFKSDKPNIESFKYSFNINIISRTIEEVLSGFMEGV